MDLPTDAHPFVAAAFHGSRTTRNPFTIRRTITFRTKPGSHCAYRGSIRCGMAITSASKRIPIVEPLCKLRFKAKLEQVMSLAKTGFQKLVDVAEVH